MAEDDICEEYRSSLMDLTCNSKPLINMLTMLAEDNVKSAPKIVQVIETHLAKASSDAKLPVLYLIDSIIKNVGGVYLDLFTQNIVSVFCSVFEKVDEKTRMQMFKLRQTWSEIFPSKKMYGIDMRVKGIDPAWPVMAPKPSQKNIHLNPRFLDGKPAPASPATVPKPIVPKTPRVTAVAATLPELEHSEVRQQLLAKQQELLKLQQQRVELELLQAKLKLEEQQKKPMNNFVTGDALSLVSGSNVPCTSSSSITAGIQTQQHSVQQVSQLGPNMLSTPLVADPRLNRMVQRLPVRDPRIQKMVPGLIHPATIITRPVALTNIPSIPQPVIAPQPHAPVTSMSRIPQTLPPKDIPFKHPIAEVSPKKLNEATTKDASPKRPTEQIIKNIKVEKEDKPTTKNNKKTSPMVIDLTAEEDSPKKNTKPKNVVKKNERNRKDANKKTSIIPDWKKKRSSPVSKRSSNRDDTRNKDHRSSRSKTRSRSRSRSPARRGKTNDKKSTKSSLNKVSSPKKSSKSKKAQTKEETKSSEPVILGDIDLRLLPSIPNVSGDVDHRISKENDKEPPVKKQKFDKDLDSLFGKNDQDYRMPGVTTDEENRRSRSDEDSEESRRSRERQKNWAQYKADHPEEFKSPLRPRENSTEAMNDKDFRIPKHSNMADDYRRRGFDRLGRPLLTNRPNHRQDFFRNQQHDDLHIALMLEKQDDILREAADQMRCGVITTEEYGRVLTKFKNLSEQFERNHPRPGFNNESGVSQLPPSKPILIDGQMRAIKFFGHRAIVLMDNSEPHEVTFTGTPKTVYLDEEEVLTLGFGGETKEFVIDGRSHTVMFGAPSREVYVDGKPYAAVFGGKQFPVVVDGKIHQLRVGGPQPNVELSEEPVRNLPLMDRDGDTSREPEKDAGRLDEDLRIGKESSLGLGDTDNRVKPELSLKELGDIDMRVAPIPGPLERLRSSPVQMGSPKSTGSPERPSRWEPIDRDRSKNRSSKTPGPWDSPRRDKSSSWNSPDRMDWKNSMDTDHRSMLEPTSHLRSGFQEDLGKKDTPPSPWNNPTPLNISAGSTANWDWRLNQTSFPTQTPAVSNMTPNIPPFQQMRPEMSNIMPNMMPNINQIQGNFHNQRMMGNIRSGNMDMSRNFNFMRQNRPPTFGMDSFSGNQFRGRMGNFNQMGMSNFDPHFDGRSQGSQGIDNFQNAGEKRMALLPHPGASTILPQPSSNILSQNSDSQGPVDVSSLLAKLISTGLIKTDATNSALAGSSSGPTRGNIPPETSAAKDSVKDEDRMIDPIPLIELIPESLKMRYPGVIDILYRGTQCASCGMRFKDSQQDKYSQHLDWHFRANRREKDGAKKAFSRKWFYDVEDWYQFEETEDLDDRARSFFELQAGEEQFQADTTPEEIPSVPASQDQSENNCVVCSEPFQMFWVEEEEEWHLKGAIRKEGKTYHPLCYEDFIKAQAAEVAETPIEESATNPLETLLETEVTEAVKIEDEAETKDEIETKAETEDEIPVKLEEPTETEEGPKPETEETKPEEMDTAEDASTTVAEPEDAEEEKVEVKEPDPSEAEPHFEEEFIGVISDSEMHSDQEEENGEAKPEAKMVTLQPGGRPSKIVMKVKADSIIPPTLALSRPATPDNAGDGDNAKPSDIVDETEEVEFKPPSPDPRFQVFAPVQRGKELSGLCSIM